jgi:transposase
MARVEVIGGVERRRRWSAEEKKAIVAEAFAPGAKVTVVARRADLHNGQLYRWKRELEKEGDGFSRVVVDPPPPAVMDRPDCAIEVMVGDKTRVRVPASIPPGLAVAVIRALVRG